MDVSWVNLGSIAASVAVGGTVAGLILKGWSIGKVVAPERVEKLEERVDAVEKIAESAASHRDLAEMQRALGAVQAAVAGVQSEVKGVHESVKSVERIMNLMLENALEREKIGAH